MSSRRPHTRWPRDWSSDVCSSDLNDKVGNIELSRIMGADVRLDSAGFDIGIRSSWENALAEVEEGSEERRVGEERRGQWWRHEARRRVTSESGRRTTSREGRTTTP